MTTALEWLTRTLASLPESVHTLRVRADLDDRDDGHPRLQPRLRAYLRGADGVEYTFCSAKHVEPPESCVAGWSALYDIADDLITECRDFTHTLPVDDGWVAVSRHDTAVDPRGATDRPPPVPAAPRSRSQLLADIERDAAAMGMGIPAVRVDPRDTTERPPGFFDVSPVLEAEAYRDVAIAMQALAAGKAMLLHVERDALGVLTWRQVRP